MKFIHQLRSQGRGAQLFQICLVLIISLCLAPAMPAMAADVYGVDSSATHVSDSVIQDTDQYLISATPKFWGRYFGGYYKGIGAFEYDPGQENSPLASNGIHLLPIASSIYDVNQDGTAGINDGKTQAKAFLDAMGSDYLAQQGSEFYIFLDVEQAGNGIPQLNSEYYLGWSQGIESVSTEQVKLLPGVYLSIGNTYAQGVLNSAMNGGAKCYGLWVAGYPFTTGWPSYDALPTWSGQFELEHETEVSVNCKTLIWQFAQNSMDEEIDLDMLNPNYAEETLSRLVIPPSS